MVLGFVAPKTIRPSVFSGAGITVEHPILLHDHGESGRVGSLDSRSSPTSPSPTPPPSLGRRGVIPFIPAFLTVLYRSSPTRLCWYRRRVLDWRNFAGLVIGAFLDVDARREERFDNPVIAIRAGRVSHTAPFAVDLFGHRFPHYRSLRFLTDPMTDKTVDFMLIRFRHTALTCCVCHLRVLGFGHFINSYLKKSPMRAAAAQFCLFTP